MHPYRPQDFTRPKVLYLIQQERLPMSAIMTRMQSLYVPLRRLISH